MNRALFLLFAAAAAACAGPRPPSAVAQAPSRAPAAPVVPAPPPVEPAAAPAVPPAETTPRSASHAHVSSGLDDPMAAPTRRLVLEWNAAVDRHDLTALAHEYQDVVTYYDSWNDPVPRSRVMAAKRALLGPGSTFHQEIVGEIDVGPGRIEASRKATFLKRSGPSGNVVEVRATIGVERTFDGDLVIVEETDERAVAAHAAWRKECEQALQAVHQVKQVTDFEAQAAAEGLTDAHSYNRLSTGPTRDGDDGTFRVDICYENDKRFVPHITYTVERRTGRIALSFDRKAVPVRAALFADVAQACRRPE